MTIANKKENRPLHGENREAWFNMCQLYCLQDSQPWATHRLPLDLSLIGQT